MWSRPLVAVLAAAGVLSLAVPAVASAHGDRLQSPEVYRALRVHGHRVVVGVHSDRIAELPRAKVLAAVRSTVAADTGGLPTLPSTGCPVEQTSDDTADAVSTDSHQVHIVYAYASDQPDRYQTFKDYAQQDVDWAQHVVAAASDGTRTIRFDLGTPCGPQYVDVTSVRLPNTLSYYQAGGDASTAFWNLVNDISPLVHPSLTHDNFTIYADGVTPSGGVTGIGMRPTGDSQSGNPAADGGQFAVVFGTATGSFRPFTLLHETTHNLGAVQDSAPHATGAAHCWDAMNVDVMCYDDGGPDIPAGTITPACQGPATVYDCNGDDYFSPDPAAGSYLTSHWNLYDSPFMCDVATCDPSTGPTNSAPPTAAFTITRPGSATPLSRVTTGTSVLLDGRASHAADGPLTYAWDLDGDGATDATGPTVTYAFPNPGTFQIRLTVTDGLNATATVTHALTVVAGGSATGTSSSTGAAAGRLGTLLGRVVAALRHAHLRGLERGRPMSVTFGAPAAGRLRVTVSAGAETVASASLTFRRAGTATVRIVPRKSVARRFGARRSKWFTVRVTFTPRSGRPTSRTRAVAVTR